MNNRLLAVLLLFAFTGTGCTHKKVDFANFTGYAQGTTYSIVFETRKNINPAELRLKVEKILQDFDMSLSLYKDSSVISRINRNEAVMADSFFTEVFKKSAAISELTSGAFDITVGPLVNAWGFGPDSHKNFDKSKLDSLMKLVGMDKVSLVNGHLEKSNPRICLDVNAIAQGYSVDVVCRFLERMGISNFLVEIGGEVKAIGTKDGAQWRIGIDKPVDNNMSPGQNLQAIVKLSDKALATSGNYRKFYIENGIKYSHTIDPRTGYPAKNTLLSSTIIADDCATADGIATACMVMGIDEAKKFINKMPQLSAYFVFSDANGNYKTWTSENMKLIIEEE